MLKPAYKLTIGGKVVDLSVTLDMDMNDEPEQSVTQELAAEFRSSRR